MLLQNWEMKLYATVSSERATKGQGGNKFLGISLKVGNAKNIIDAGVVRIEIIDGHFIGYYISDICREGVNLFKIKEKTKGKNQKGENVCFDCDHAICTRH